MIYVGELPRNVPRASLKHRRHRGCCSPIIIPFSFNATLLCGIIYISFFRNRKEMMSIGLFLSRPVLPVSADLTLFFPWRVFGWNIFQHWKVFLLNEACRTCRISESFSLMMPLQLSTHAQSFREEKQKKNLQDDAVSYILITFRSSWLFMKKRTIENRVKTVKM